MPSVSPFSHWGSDSSWLESSKSGPGGGFKPAYKIGDTMPELADLSVIPPVPPTDPLHNHLRLVRNLAVEGMVPAVDAADHIQTLAYLWLVAFEEASRVEQEVRGLPPAVAGKMPPPLEDL